MESLNNAFEYGELLNSQKRAVITLVEKKGKDKKQIKIGVQCLLLRKMQK